jgi:hypothetical protein
MAGGTTGEWGSGPCPGLSLRVVGDQPGGGPKIRVEADQETEDFFRCGGVEMARRLIEQPQGGVARQGVALDGALRSACQNKRP